MNRSFNKYVFACIFLSNISCGKKSNETADKPILPPTQLIQTPVLDTSLIYEFKMVKAISCSNLVAKLNQKELEATFDFTNYYGNRQLGTIEERFDTLAGCDSSGSILLSVSKTAGANFKTSISVNVSDLAGKLKIVVSDCEDKTFASLKNTQPKEVVWNSDLDVATLNNVQYEYCPRAKDAIVKSLIGYILKSSGA